MHTSTRTFTLSLISAAMFLCAVQVNAQRVTKARGVRAPVSDQTSKRQDIENIVREYLIKNPEVIREAMQALQEKEEAQKKLGLAENMKKLRPEILSDASAPVTGNASGDVSVVVFYDYFCGYCKKTLPELQNLVAKDHSVKIIYKEFPILGAQSLIAARAALEAARQGKFEAFHREMIESDSTSDEAIKAISDKLGLDWAQLRKDMNDPQIDTTIERNQKLATALNIEGTPAYLVGDRIIPGAIDSESLVRLINDERAKLARVH